MNFAFTVRKTVLLSNGSLVYGNGERSTMMMTDGGWAGSRYRVAFTNCCFPAPRRVAKRSFPRTRAARAVATACQAAEEMPSWPLIRIHPPLHLSLSLSFTSLSLSLLSSWTPLWCVCCLVSFISLVMATIPFDLTHLAFTVSICCRSVV